MKESQRKASKGSVQIKVSNGRLQLVFSYQGKRQYLSLGLPDTKLSRKVAEAKAKIIESDMALERFDSTLSRYKPQKIQEEEETSENSIPTDLPVPDLLELWEKYAAFKQPQISLSTYSLDYRKYRNHIANLPTRNLKDTVSIRDYLVANLTPDAARRLLTNINACCNWALKSQLIDTNPFIGMASQIHIPKKGHKTSHIRSFSPEERNAIIEAFQSSEIYNYYAPLVRFLFFTGCRPSEAIALQWQHISTDWKLITFEQSCTVSRNGLVIKKGLKTQSLRQFPINNQLRTILEELQTEKYNSEDLIFKGKQGGLIDFGDFLNHAWKGYKNRHGRQIDGIVTRLNKQGIISQYLKPYACRHTFITLALEHGLDVKDVARLVGNSPEVIYRHYATNRRELFVPEL